MKQFHFGFTFKILFFLLCYISGIILMWDVSREDLHTAEEKFNFLEAAYRLDNIILEVRRYEKNFLLYNTPKAFEEHKKYLTQAENSIATLRRQLEKLKAAPMLKELEDSMHQYHYAFEQLVKSDQGGSEEYKANVVKTRDIGQLLTAQSSNLLEFERFQLQSILRELETRMSFWSIVAIILGILMPVITFLKIIRPLSIIKKATDDIAQGRFKHITVLQTRDEMQQVMEAFNTMVFELEKQQDQLVQSQKLSSIGTLTAGVAHQLNNPLNNISTSCQIAMEDLGSADMDFIKKMLGNIEQETLRARDVVKGLLEFSRVQEFKLRTANLAEVASRAVRLVQSQVPANISIRVNISPDLEIPMDVQRMQEVFLNLIINSSQAIGDKGEISISAVISENDDTVVIEVRDTGPGIPKNIQGQLFDPFYTTKDEGKGTGLGLSVVYGIIKKHQGEIRIISEPGEGASFQISLPLKVKEREA
ncbi:sensor histidine kinase [Desulfopila sp. IMCC35008]|uniref:sensor histidine kinase n=1 Tax=Desulfopila sp. IMCC35008 TaxID=2653858 RepID=UPI0013D7E6F5|nr:ATP-binding protein [Desulfopila sp. IMCC35008]